MNNKELILTLYLLNNISKKFIKDFIFKYNIFINLDYLYNFLKLYTLSSNQNIIINFSQLFKANNKAKSIISYCENNNINILTFIDKEFPRQLNLMKNTPIFIFYIGNINIIKNGKNISIIGSRNPSIESMNSAYLLAKYLSDRNISIISGLARGCDENAHQGTLNALGNTAAILPCGLNNIYPPKNIELGSQIIEFGGCIISEYLPFEDVSKYKFIERNHIISSLSIGILAIEFKDNSGTLSTIEYALKNNIKVGYFPSLIKNINFNASTTNIISNLVPITDELSLNNFLKYIFSSQKNEDIFHKQDNQLYFRM